MERAAGCRTLRRPLQHRRADLRRVEAPGIKPVGFKGSRPRSPQGPLTKLSPALRNPARARGPSHQLSIGGAGPQHPEPVLRHEYDVYSHRYTHMRQLPVLGHAPTYANPDPSGTGTAPRHITTIQDGGSSRPTEGVIRAARSMCARPSSMHDVSQCWMRTQDVLRGLTAHGSTGILDLHGNKSTSIHG